MVFWTVGISWEFLVVATFVVNMLVCRSYGNSIHIPGVLCKHLTIVILYCRKCSVRYFRQIRKRCDVLIGLWLFRYSTQWCLYVAWVRNLRLLYKNYYYCYPITINVRFYRFRSLPSILYYFRNFSIFFLGCETLSILQWRNFAFIRKSNFTLITIVY